MKKNPFGQMNPSTVDPQVDMTKWPNWKCKCLPEVEVGRSVGSEYVENQILLIAFHSLAPGDYSHT